MRARELDWHKSSYSGSQGDCVEIGWSSQVDVAVRDSKHPTGPTLSFPATTWRAFLKR